MQTRSPGVSTRTRKKVQSLSPEERERLRQEYQASQQKAQQNFPSDKEAGACTQPCPPQAAVASSPAPAQQPGPVARPVPASSPAPSDEVKLKCKDGWDDCQKAQAREKVRRLNELANNSGGLERAVPKVAKGDRDDADFWAGKFRQEFERITRGELNPGKAESGATGGSGDFMHSCLENQWQKMKTAGKQGEFLDTVSPDHVQDIQLKGNPEGPLKWMDRSVNTSLGSQIRSSGVNKIRKFILDCP